MTDRRTVGSTEARFRILPVVPADVADLLTLIRDLAAYENLSAACSSTERDLTDALFGASPAAEALIARPYANTNDFAGFALFFQTYSTFQGRRNLWLEDLFVRPEYRRRGLGAELLRSVATIADGRGCGRFEWAVLDWNVDAVRFYESLGAIILSDWRIARVAGDAIGRLAGTRSTSN